MDLTDVLIIGGGPVGIATSLALRARGFSVRVLERATEIYDLPRAIVMDDEIQRVFADLGMGDDIAAITTPLRGAEFVRPDGERIIGADLPLDADWPLGHHPSVTYYQPEFEACLRANAIARGVEIELGFTVDEIGQTPDHTVAAGLDIDGTATIHRGTWMIAADGAASPIRKQLGVAFVDQGFDQDWLVLDVELTRPTDRLPTLVQQICDPARPTTFVIGHADYRRWEFQLQPGERREDMAEPARVWELLEPWLTPGDARLVRAVVYRFHATVAESMRVGRVFIAGDAAHQMPPFLGQGLCSGIRDGVNLAWKLQLVATGRADDIVLDTYNAERGPHAAGTVAHAVDTGKLIDHLAGRDGTGPGLDAAYGGGRPAPRIEHGVIAGDHPTVGRQLMAPILDGRRLDEHLGTGFALVVRNAAVAQPILAAWGAVGLQVVEVDDDHFTAQLTERGAIFVRPDRYVAAVAADADDVRRHSDALLTAMGSPPNP